MKQSSVQPNEFSAGDSDCRPGGHRRHCVHVRFVCGAGPRSPGIAGPSRQGLGPSMACRASSSSPCSVMAWPGSFKVKMSGHFRSGSRSSMAPRPRPAPRSIPATRVGRNTRPRSSVWRMRAPRSWFGRKKIAPLDPPGVERVRKLLGAAAHEAGVYLLARGRHRDRRRSS